MKSVQKFIFSASHKTSKLGLGLVLLAIVAACARETRNPKIQIHVVDTAPQKAPAPEGSKTGDADTAAVPVATAAPVASPVANPSAPSNPASAKPATQRPVTWAIVNEKVVAPRCATCHSGTKPAAGLDLTSAEKFKEAAPNIFAFVFYPPAPEAKMPLGGNLTEEQKQVLGDYMVDGLLP